MAKKKGTKKIVKKGTAHKATKKAVTPSRKIAKPASSDKMQKLDLREKLLKSQNEVNIEACHCKDNEKHEVKDFFIKRIADDQLEVSEIRGRMRVTETVSKGGTSMYAFGRGFSELAKLAAKSGGLWSLCKCKTIGKKGSITSSKKK